MFDKCIVDLGANDGGDTIMYLNQGYYVFSIDANPEMTDQIKRSIPKKYNSYCTILNFGLSDQEKDIEFYINHFSPWSSFNKEVGSRIAHWKENKGLKQTINIKTTTIKKIYSEYISKKFLDIEYLKIDIEGKDLVVLKSLEDTSIRPKFISCELGSIDILNTMKNLGYDKFKIISQHELKNKQTNITTINNEIIEYTLPDHTSGHFGKDIKNWISFEDATQEILKIDRSAGRWYDIHGSAQKGIK